MVVFGCVWLCLDGMLGWDGKEWDGFGWFYIGTG